MQMLWCWRCRAEMPMLDEQEFAEIRELHRECILALKEFREKRGIPLEGVALEQHFVPLTVRYQQLTGMYESNPNAILHHELASYGPPCRHCSKPLRTPKAKLCAGCMSPAT